MEALQARLEELEARLQSDEEVTPTTYKEVTASLSTRFERSPRTQKLPDPPLFTDGKDPEWEDWYGKVKDKLSINAEFFPNEQVKLAYVFSRLAGQAAKVTLVRRNSDINPYTTVGEVLKELADMFDDPDKEENVRRDYKDLIQGSTKFSEFYAQFQQLSSYLGYHEKQLIADLKDRISPRLRLAWASQANQFGSLIEVRTFLVRFDNELRVIRKQKDKESSDRARRSASEPAKATKKIMESTKVTVDTSKPRDPFGLASKKATL